MIPPSIRGAVSLSEPTPPLTAADDAGRTVRLTATTPADCGALTGLYADFAPSDCAQGVPPMSERAVEQWVANLLDGQGVRATHDGATVGHVALVAGDDGHELSAFVHPDYRRARIGTALLRTGLGAARERGVDRVWVTVAAGDPGVVDFYAGAGFRPVDDAGPVRRLEQSL